MLLCSIKRLCDSVPKLTHTYPTIDPDLSYPCRYYLNSNSTMQHMEKILMDDSKNVDMWIKLVYKKLHENRYVVFSIGVFLP